jgi:sulfur carrier protein
MTVSRILSVCNSRRAGRIIRTMQVQLSHPARTVDIKGPKRAKDVLRELNLVVEAHLVIRDDELVTEDELLSDKDRIEIRPVISGGTP